MLLCGVLTVIAVQGRGVMEAIVKSLNQSDIVEGGSFTNKRQPIRSVPRLTWPQYSPACACLSLSAIMVYICHLHHLAKFMHGKIVATVPHSVPALSQQLPVSGLQLGEAISACEGEERQQPSIWGKCRTRWQQLCVGVWRALWA